MTSVRRSRFRRALEHAAHSGFPWVMRGSTGGLSRPLRRSIRRSVTSHWPPGFRLPGQILMALLWPLESLRDAAATTFELDRGILGEHRRVMVALRAWGAALGYNLPPIDYLSYRLFEPGRPGPGSWLHSADAHLHFDALTAPEVRSIAGDKLAFADLGYALGVAVMPVLAVYGADGPVRPFASGFPPPQDLLIKPRWGHGSRGHVIWRWQDGTHVSAEPFAQSAFTDWLTTAARSGDLLVQPLAKPPDRLGPYAPLRAPDISIFTAEWPDGRRAASLALITLVYDESGVEMYFSRLIDLQSGLVLPASPGQFAPIWGGAPDRREHQAFAIPGWPEILTGIERLHAALPGSAPVLKWDFLLTDQGPKLLETNTGASVYALQTMTLRPITETPLGAALEEWAR